MTISSTLEKPRVQTQRLFPYDRWRSRLPGLANEYRANQPFPHIHLSDFLDADLARRIAKEFPRPTDTSWIQYKHYNENKLGKTNRAEFPPLIGQLIDELNSAEFVSWLSQLTGIPNLMPDPSLEGGGMHQTERGGFLNMHADFTHHHHHPNWRRRCNLILYLNEGWKQEWGGAIEFWDREMKQCAAKVFPLLNHAVIFNTDEESYHGYPDSITPPEGVTRKSIALYYYTEEADSKFTPRSTNYQPRPEDGRLRSSLIWLDKKTLAIYSKIKSKLGLSDNFASKILGFFGRKKK
jgi:Rps23 Pro-64 3,4-dihydroxylase Tpa1-like proline 4-hydroxylase